MCVCVCARVSALDIYKFEKKGIVFLYLITANMSLFRDLLSDLICLEACSYFIISHNCSMFFLLIVLKFIFSPPTIIFNYFPYSYKLDLVTKPSKAYNEQQYWIDGRTDVEADKEVKNLDDINKDGRELIFLSIFPSAVYTLYNEITQRGAVLIWKNILCMNSIKL